MDEHLRRRVGGLDTHTEPLYFVGDDASIIVNKLPAAARFNHNIPINIKERLYRHILTDDGILRNEGRLSLPDFLCVPRRREDSRIGGVSGIIGRWSIQV